MNVCRVHRDKTCAGGSGNVIPLLRCLCGCAAFFDSDRFVHRCRRTPFFAMMRGNRPDSTVPAVSGYHSAWERNGLRPVGFSGIHEFTIFLRIPEVLCHQLSAAEKGVLCRRRGPGEMEKRCLSLLSLFSAAGLLRQGGRGVRRRAVRVPGSGLAGRPGHRCFRQMSERL